MLIFLNENGGNKYKKFFFCKIKRININIIKYNNNGMKCLPHLLGGVYLQLKATCVFSGWLFTPPPPPLSYFPPAAATRVTS